MKKSTTIWMWIVTVFFILSALVYFPSFSSLFALLIVCLVLPATQWQDVLKKFVHGKLKIAVVIILILLTIFTAPTTDVDNTPNIPTTETTVPTTESTTETTTEPTTEPTTAPTAEPTTTPTAEPTTTPTTEPAASPTTVPLHTHSFSAATCTAPKTCSCGATEGKATGHNWKDATCTKPKTCTSCNATEGSTAEHSWNEATYTSPKTCAVCGTTEGSPLDVPGKENYHGHVYTGGDKSTKYHYEADCAGKYSHEITWEEVERRNLGPCGTCVLK